MSDLIHQYGLKAGIYSDCGTKTCEKHFASYGYEELQAQDYKDWGYDFLKEDWYFDLDMAPTGQLNVLSKKEISPAIGIHAKWHSNSIPRWVWHLRSAA